jgi:anti-sigma factor RsiW
VRIVDFGSSAHRQVEAMLPWYASGTLDAQERALVESHLAQCPRCQGELAWERRLQAAHAAATEAGDTSTAADADAGLAAMHERIDAASRPRRWFEPWQRAWNRGPLAWRLALAVQAAAIVVLCLMLVPWPARDATYRALGSAPAATGVAGAGRLVVRFRPEATEQEMRRVLRNSDARVIYGPTTTDAYLLTVPAGSEKAAVARLRKDSAVLLAESLDGEAPR